MKNIAYIELDTHAEIANNFLELSNNFRDVSVDFYFSEKIFKILDVRQKNVFLSDVTTILEQLKGKDYDEIIIGTVHRYFLLFSAIVKKYKTSIIVHNINFSKTTSKQLFFNIFKNDLMFRVKLFLKEGLNLAPNIYKNACRLLVIDEKISLDFQQKFFPVFYNEFNERNRIEDLIKIVIPGIVSQKRRDYFSFLRKLKSFEETNYNYKITFLGKASGKELEFIKSYVKQLPNYISINFFEEKVPQNVYEEIINEADFLYCPIQTKTDFLSVPEIYGKTKVSGNIGDAIKYSKMAIFPSVYLSEMDFIIKEKDNLQQQFSEVLNLEFNFSTFSKAIISKKLESVFVD